MEIKIGQGGRRTLTITVVEDDGSLAPLATMTAASAAPVWTATGTVQNPNTSAKLVVDGTLTATVGRYVMTVTPTLVDGDIEPQKVTVIVV